MGLKDVVFTDFGRAHSQRSLSSVFGLRCLIYALDGFVAIGRGGALPVGKIRTDWIRRAMMAMGDPQQRHLSCARVVGGVGTLAANLKTRSLSSAIMRLLLGCKKP